MTDPRQAYRDAGAHASQRTGRSPVGGRVLVGLSGKTERADSFLVAALLRSQGYEVVGLHLRVSPPADSDWAGFKASCIAQPPVERVQEICAKLDIPLHIEDVHERMIHEVSDFAIHEALKNRVSRLCVPCNDRIRIPTLLKKAEELRCERVATGHHVQVVHDLTGGPVRLMRSANRGLDQSYDLFRLTQETLGRLLTPLGSLSPSLLSRLVQELELPPATGYAAREEKVCFTESPGYSQFIESKVAQGLRMPGVIRSLEGAVFGDHQGLFRYRLGQGLGQSNREGAERVVVGFAPSSGALIAGSAKDLVTDEVLVAGIHWIRPVDGLRPRRCQVVVRHGAAPRTCDVIQFENGTAHLRFAEKLDNAIPGQSAVFYDGDEVLGGGLIDSLRMV